MTQTTGSRSAAEGAARAADGAAQAADGAAQAAAAAARDQVVLDPVQAPIVYEVRRPIVYEVRKSGRGKGKKKKYSRGLKDPQKLEQDGSRAAERVAQAVTDGISEYRDNRDKSACRKRDGAIKDAVRNTGRGLSEALNTASRAPRDLTRRATAKRLTRMMMVVPPPFSYFMRGR